MLSDKSKKNMLIRYAVAFIMFCVVCYFFPYSGDDWAWGTEIGTYRLDVWFYKYNGRYLGNLLVLIMTRSVLIKTLVMSVTLTGIVFCFEKLAKSKWGYYLALVSIVIMPRAIFRQGIVWSSGFSNYAVGVVFSLIYVVYVYKMLGETEEKQSITGAISMLFVGFLGALLMENLTIYNMVLSVGVLLFVFFTRKKVYIQHVSYFIGTLIGTIYMFANGAYSAVANSEDIYRTVGEGGILHKIKENYLTIIYKDFFLNNIAINLFIAVVLFLIIYEFKKKGMLTKPLVVAYSVFSIYTAYSALSSLKIDVAAREGVLAYFEGAFTIVAIVALAACAVIIGKKVDRLWNALFWIASIACLVAPLFVVEPIGDRNFLTTYFMFVGFIVELLLVLIKLNKDIVSFKYFAFVGKIVAIAGFGFYLLIFANASYVESERLAKIDAAVKAGKTKVSIRHLPYEAFIWTGSPEEEPWIERYKKFYNIPENIKIKCIWNDKKY